MAVFSPTNAKVHFKAYDGNFTDALGNTAITQNNGVAMATAQKLFGQQAMFMANFSDSITFNTPSVFDVGTGDYTVGFWFHPTQLTSYDRLFATGPDSGGNPFRIYNHNGSIGVYVENDDEVPGDANHDLIINYYLGAGAANQWWHIMVQRNSGTTKLYINGTEQGSSTVSYEIDNSSSPTLGADINAAATGVKGYIQDFFWTEEAVSFSQADFDPSTPEPVTFHSGNPSISSFSSSASSVSNSGDTVTLSWNVSGETKLELLKYVGGILNSTEDVLGLSSKSVTITETVSYKIRATNDNSAVDSSSVEITLSGGNSMAFGLLSGSLPKGIGSQLHGKMLGGLITGSNNEYLHLPVQGQALGNGEGIVDEGDVTAGVALVSGFAGASGSIIQALNAAYNVGSFAIGQGIDGTAFSGGDTLQVSASEGSFAFGSSSNGYRLELADAVAGDALGLVNPLLPEGGKLHVKVDDTGIEVSSDALRLKDGGVLTAKLADEAVTNAKVAANAINTDQIVNDAVNSFKIIAGAVQGPAFGTAAVSASAIGANAVTTAKIQADAVTGLKIGALAVSGAHIAAGAVVEAKIGAGAVTEAKIGAAAVNGAQIAALAVSASALGANAVTTAKIANDAVTTAKVADLGLSASNMADDSVVTRMITDANVTRDKVANESITHNKLASGSVDADNIKASAVVEAKLGAGAVTEAKIGAAAVNGAQIAALAVSASNIGADAVETAKINDEAVTTAKIGPDAVTNAKIADSAVDTEHLNGAVIGGANLQPLAVSASALGTDAVTSAKIQADAVTGVKIGALEISGSHIKNDSINSFKIIADAVTGEAMGVAAISASALGAESVETAKIKDLNVTTGKLANEAVTTAKIEDSNVTNAKLAADVFSSNHTFSGVQQFGVDKLRVSGSDASGAHGYFSFKVEGGILVLTSQI